MNFKNYIPPREMKKQKFIEIALTALISAGIAFLQSLLAQHYGAQNLNSNPEQAGVIGMAISSLRNYKHFIA